MELKTTSIAGTMESSDIMITIEPGVGALEIELTSTVEKQFGREIRRVIHDTLCELDVVNARVTAVDKGALDCAIRARVRAAAYRAALNTAYDWGGKTP